jgi:hypothetical protein
VQSDRRTFFTRAGVRVGAGVAGIAASAVVVIAALTLPLPSAHARADSRTVTPVPATATVACPGPLLSLDVKSSAASLVPDVTPNVVSGGDATSPTPVPVNAADVQAGGAGPAAFREPSIAGKEPMLAAATSVAGNTGELHGLAVENCTQPGFDQWLVGGATSLGATTLVVITNPGDVAATVNIDTYFEQGAAAGAGGHGILVQPNTQRIVPLAGLAPNATATIVHVTSTGGTVSAELQQSQVSGVTPQGVDWVGSTAPPSDKVVVPGVVVAAQAASGASDADGGGVPTLRVLPVGDNDAKLTIGVRPDAGTGGGQATSVTVSHGVVSEVPLDKVGSGTYTVTVDSTEPIVAAVRSTTSDAAAGADFGWYEAAQRLDGAAAVPVTRGPNPALHIVNPTDSAVTLRLDGPGGATISVPAGASVSRSVATREVLTTTDSRGLYISVGYQGPGQLGGYVAYPTGASASALTVYKR